MMSGWNELRQTYRALRAAADANEPLHTLCAHFCEQAADVARNNPEHLTLILRTLTKQTGDLAQGQVAILDHGCGSGMTLMVLAALGYSNVFGVDVGGNLTALNRIGREILGHQEDRFLVYAGDILPLADASIDFIVSQQVLEHVRPAVYERYYGEEARVLRPGGCVYHQVPHRLVPFESHTRTWMLHYMPRSLFLASLRLLQGDLRGVDAHLYLRWPWRHRLMARRLIGPCQDVTVDRLRAVRNFENYDGVAGLRKLIDRAIDAPLVGGVLARVVA